MQVIIRHLLDNILLAWPQHDHIDEFMSQTKRASHIAIAHWLVNLCQILLFCSPHPVSLLWIHSQQTAAAVSGSNGGPGNKMVFNNANMASSEMAHHKYPQARHGWTPYAPIACTYATVIWECHILNHDVYSCFNICMSSLCVCVRTCSEWSIGTLIQADLSMSSTSANNLARSEHKAQTKTDEEDLRLPDTDTWHKTRQNIVRPWIQTDITPQHTNDNTLRFKLHHCCLAKFWNKDFNVMMKKCWTMQ